MALDVDVRAGVHDAIADALRQGGEACDAVRLDTAQVAQHKMAGRLRRMLRRDARMHEHLARELLQPWRGNTRHGSG